jgi:hypothetical protein
LFIVDFRSARDKPAEQEKIVDYVLANAKGDQIVIKAMTVAGTWGRTGSEMTSEDTKSSLAKHVARQARSAHASRTAYFSKMNKTMHSSLQAVETVLRGRGITTPQGNVHFLGTNVLMKVGGVNKKLHQVGAEDACVAQSLSKAQRLADLSSWSLRVVGMAPDGQGPNGSLERAIAAMVVATAPGASGPGRVFYGFGSLACPGELPDPVQLNGFNVNGACDVKQISNNSNSFACPNPNPPVPPVPVPPTPVPPIPVPPTPVPPTPVPPIPVPPIPVPPAPPVPPVPPIGTPPVAVYEAGQSQARLDALGATIVTSIITQPQTKTPATSANARVAVTSATARASLLLGSIVKGDNIRTSDISAAATADRRLSARIITSQLCAQGKPVSVDILWSAKGSKWRTTIKGYIASCSSKQPTTVFLGYF